MNNKVLIRLAAILLVLTLTACQAIPTSTPAPTSEPTATSTPTNTPIPSTSTPTPAPSSTATPRPTSTATSSPASTATPRPPSKVDTGMGGSLSIQGVVRDSFGKTVPNAYVALQVYGARGGWDIGQFGNWGLYTDGTGSYSFDKVVRLESGHYEVWFNGKHEYGKAYENSGYWIDAHEISGNVYVLDVTVHAVTGSAFSGVIQYEDVDGSIKSFYSPPFTQPEPGHLVDLVRGIPDNVEYGIGGEYSRIAGGTTEWPGLAGGMYYLSFTYRRLDGVLVQCNSPAFEIPPGGTKRLEYTIRNCPPSAAPLLP